MGKKVLEIPDQIFIHCAGGPEFENRGVKPELIFKKD